MFERKPKSSAEFPPNIRDSVLSPGAADRAVAIACRFQCARLRPTTASHQPIPALKALSHVDETISNFPAAVVGLHLLLAFAAPDHRKKTPRLSNTTLNPTTGRGISTLNPSPRV
ncbi:hypothetical protein AAHC03_022702 [Spirometra sp. Aus1]